MDLQAQIDDLFATHPSENVAYQTNDGQFFFAQSNADAQAQRLVNRGVAVIYRPGFEPAPAEGTPAGDPTLNHPDATLPTADEIAAKAKADADAQAELDAQLAAQQKADDDAKAKADADAQAAQEAAEKEAADKAQADAEAQAALQAELDAEAAEKAAADQVAADQAKLAEDQAALNSKKNETAPVVKTDDNNPTA